MLPKRHRAEAHLGNILGNIAPLSGRLKRKRVPTTFAGTRLLFRTYKGGGHGIRTHNPLLGI